MGQMHLLLNYVGVCARENAEARIDIYQQCDERHHQRDLNAFTFRYSHRIKVGINDDQRVGLSAFGMGGKRVAYRRLVRANAPRHLVGSFLRWRAKI